MSISIERYQETIRKAYKALLQVNASHYNAEEIKNIIKEGQGAIFMLHDEMEKEIKDATDYQVHRKWAKGRNKEPLTFKQWKEHNP